MYYTEYRIDNLMFSSKKIISFILRVKGFCKVSLFIALNGYPASMIDIIELMVSVPKFLTLFTYAYLESYR